MTSKLSFGNKKICKMLPFFLPYLNLKWMQIINLKKNVSGTFLEKQKTLRFKSEKSTKTFLSFSGSQFSGNIMAAFFTGKMLIICSQCSRCNSWRADGHLYGQHVCSSLDGQTSCSSSTKRKILLNNKNVVVCQMDISSKV